ncbi:MAG: DUF1800 domain-containing protein [Chitinophagales bacterium]
MPIQDCITSGIAAYVPSVAKPWDNRRITHLYRRMGFGATHQQIVDGLAQNPDALIEQIVEDAYNLPLSPTPIWADWTLEPLYGYTSLEDYNTERRNQRYEWIYQFFTDMLNNGFRDKLTFFWHNHFVTETGVYDASVYLYAYHKILQQNALGNFRDFVYDMGKTPAMLIYLDGYSNTRNSPNENYGRELYELFTLGVDNGYTQADIEETSRALTGWQVNRSALSGAYFTAGRFDLEEKTIFGQTGIWNYDDVHDILFQERTDEIATHICTKLYKYFIYETPDENIVAALATTFKNNNFELKPVLKQLFKSEHFFDDAFIGTRIKSPVECFMNLIHQTGIEYDDGMFNDVRRDCNELSQAVFAPVDVAGWQGYRSWITEDSLTKRWDFVRDTLLDTATVGTKANWVTLAKNLSDNSYDPLFITTKIVDFLLPNGFNRPETYEVATRVFKGDIPQNYFENGYWSLDWEEAGDQMFNLLKYIIKLPEFQLA